MQKQSCIEAGYINFGYFSPELSTLSEYPEYIKNEAKRCVNKILSHQTKDSVTFGFMTDIHYSQTPNHDIRTKRLMNAYNEISGETGTEMLILGGDYVNDGLRAYKIKNYKMLREHLGMIRYYPVNGNHDDNSIWDIYTENTVSENHLSNKEIYDVFYNHLPEKGAEFDDKNSGFYYMYNDYDSKIRYIFLDTSDIPEKYDENGVLLYTKQHTFGLQQAQVDWLINKALVFKDSGWSIIFISHTLKDENLKLLTDISEAFKSREKLEKSYEIEDYEVKVNADFLNADAEIICFICGHYHNDFVEYTKSKIPCIYCGNVIMYKTLLPRIDNDKSELLFDFVTVCKSDRKIYLTRVGAGNDRIISY